MAITFEQFCDQTRQILKSNDSSRNYTSNLAAPAGPPQITPLARRILFLV